MQAYKPQMPLLSVRVSCMQAYTSYKVCTVTDAEEFRTKQPEVIRRYRDFCWLHDRLTEQHRGAIPDVAQPFEERMQLLVD